MSKARLYLSGAFCLLVACSSHGPTSTFIPPAARFTTQSVGNTMQTTRFVVTLPIRNHDALLRFLDEVSDPSSPMYQHFLTPEQFAAKYGPRESDLHSLEIELQRAGFSTDRDALGVSASGTLANVERYFGTSLVQTTWPMRNRAPVTQFAARTPLHVSPLLRSLGASVLGLANLPPFHTFSDIRPAPEALLPHSLNGPYGPYATPDLKQAYRWPSTTDVKGTGVTMAVVIDLPVKTSDTNYYAQHSLLQSSFKLNQVAVDGGGKWNIQGSGEASLDAEQSLGMAPGATLYLYDVGTLSGQNIYDGYNAAVKNKSVSVVNSSFGSCEEDFASASGKSALAQFDQLFQMGSAQGVTFVASSGDQAAYSCPQNVFNKVAVNWPAMDQYVLGVGGTNLTVSTGANSTYVSESEFDEPLGSGRHWGSGGGYSKIVKRPSWQNGFSSNPGRSVPDMSLHMGGEGFSGNGCSAQRCNPNDSSDLLRIGGQWFLSIGTSASSPDIVGLIALRVQKQHAKMGDIHKWLYANGKGGMWRKGIKGNNGYATTSGPWDPVLGLGTPYGNKFVGTSSTAGTPGTSTNP